MGTVYFVSLPRVQLIITITSFTLAVQAQRIKMKLLSILIFALSLAYASGFRCYLGGGDKLPDRTCKPGVGASEGYDACLKTNLDGEIIRGCGDSSLEINCGQDPGVCACKSDLCNGATSFTPTTGVTFALIGSFISRFF